MKRVSLLVVVLTLAIVGILFSSRMSPEPTQSTVRCEHSLADLTSTDKLTLVEGPLPCNASDDKEILCGIFKARIEATGEEAPKHVILAVRTKSTQELCSNRWVVLDAGGFGDGYAATFGDAPPGGYSPKGQYGDDLIRRYNDLGYVTVDLVYQCEKEACDTFAYGDWVAQQPAGTAWFENLNGTGWLGAAQRSLSVYEWAHEQSGEQICAHAQSSGSGRLIGALTRLEAESLFDTVVFDGGPVFNYTPWICGVDEGPLGPSPLRTSRNQDGIIVARTLDCALTLGDNTQSCSANDCAGNQYSQNLLQSSMWYLASTLNFTDLDIGIALGGQDKTNAPWSVKLWLSGYDYNDKFIPPLSAHSITLKQGYCEDCALWDQDTYEDRLRDAPHGVSETEGGAEVLEELLTHTCEL